MPTYGKDQASEADRQNQASETDRQNVKAVLEAAKLEIGNALERVDSASPLELATLKGAAHQIAAFVDFNSGCGRARGTDLIRKLQG